MGHEIEITKLKKTRLIAFNEYTKLLLKYREERPLNAGLDDSFKRIV